MRPRSNQRRLMLKTGKTENIITPTEQPRVQSSSVKETTGLKKIPWRYTIYVHIFAGRVSTYFLVSFTDKNS